MKNWIETLNPFGLVRPPDWFLAELAAYDPLLVMFASIEEGVYRLARRVRFTPGLLNVLRSHPDTKLFVQHRLVPVRSVVPPRLGLDWSRVIPDLAMFDIDRVGGAEKAADRLDQFDIDEDARRRAETAELAGVLARDCYGPVKAQVGERVSLTRYRPRPKPRYGKPALRGGGSAVLVGRAVRPSHSMWAHDAP